LCTVVAVKGCPHGIELQIDDVIAADDQLDGVFTCAVSGFNLEWRVDGVEYYFFGSSRPGSLQTSSLQPNSTAILFVIGGSVGTRISAFHYVPNPGVSGPVEITCGGYDVGSCTTSIFVGECL
jgi:hypothetical protein